MSHIHICGRARRPPVIGLTLLLMAGAALPAVAQTTPRAPDGSRDAGTADFMFGRPRLSLGVRGGWMFAREGSDLFDFLKDQLTIDEGDFAAPALAVDFGVALASRMDVVAGFEFSRAKIASEYRDYVDNDFLPIEQETRLTSLAVTGSVRLALTPRGRRVSRYVWIPAAVTPYIGAGGGILWYKFEQSGDFVDFSDLSVFSDVFRASGPAATGHVFGGIDIRAYRRLYVTAEGRYLWASGELGSDFVDFDPIDLAGFRFTGGVTLLF